MSNQEHSLDIYFVTLTPLAAIIFIFGLCFLRKRTLDRNADLLAARIMKEETGPRLKLIEERIIRKVCFVVQLKLKMLNS